MTFSRGTTFTLGAIGVLAILVGFFGWRVETDTSPYAFGTNPAADGTTQVWDITNASDIPYVGMPGEQDESAAYEAAGATLVFTGTEQEALRYIDEQHAEADSFLIPGLAIGVGAVLMGLAIWSARSTRHREPVNT